MSWEPAERSGVRCHNVSKTADHLPTIALCVELREGQGDVGCFLKLNNLRALILPGRFQEVIKSCSAVVSVR